MKPDFFPHNLQSNDFLKEILFTLAFGNAHAHTQNKADVPTAETDHIVMSEIKSQRPG